MSPASLPLETTVDYLLNPRNGWHAARLREHFLPTDVELILTLKLPSEHKDDAVFWHFDKCSMYIVKSGYHLAMQLRDSATAGLSVGVSKGWNLIWTLQVPAKVKIFLCRILDNVLPTKVNLVIRKVLSDASCSLCGSLCETLMHALFHCAFAQKVWRETIFADFGIM